MSTLAKEIDEWFVMTSCEKDDRPEVLYRPLGHIMIGFGAMVIPVNHYNREMVTNLGTALTDTVIAYDKSTGAFETKRTRYVLDKSYKH